MFIMRSVSEEILATQFDHTAAKISPLWKVCSLHVSHEGGPRGGEKILFGDLSEKDFAVPWL
jgi:hypothetical protein